MSHRPERKEKDCLNCGTIVQGKYCHFCGQENAVPKETFWQLVTHFVYDLTHFDGNFFSTIKYLLFRPGYLSSEYIKGRRVRYLNPIRMYIFTSAFFFLFFFSVVKTEETINFKNSKDNAAQMKENIAEKKALLQKALTSTHLTPSIITVIKSQILLLEQDEERLKTDTTNLNKLNYFKINDFDITPQKFSTVREYDSLQKTLPAKEKDKWIKRSIERRKLSLQEKYGRDTRLIINKLFDKFMHSFPQMLFVSLPLMALLLQLLYVRRRKTFYYVDHIIYSVHLYCAMFIFIFILMCLSRMADWRYMSWLSYVVIGVFLYLFWYIYKSMRNFYKQSRTKTIFKFLLLLFISFFVMTFLFLVFLILSAYTI